MGVHIISLNLLLAFGILEPVERGSIRGIIVAETVIEISNCNNISEAKISITENTLNIKYGCNGTGKSTISEAIRIKTEGKRLEVLKPFTDDENDDANPLVNDIKFTKVKVFNEDYIKNYLFKSEGIFADSYSVLLQSKEC